MKKILTISLILSGVLMGADCNVFSNVLQTRDEPSEIILMGDAKIYNDLSCVLKTSEIDQDLNTKRILECVDNHSLATSARQYGGVLDVNYTFNVKKTNLWPTVTNSSKTIVIKLKNQKLNDSEYNSIFQNWHHYSFSLTYNGDKKVNHIRNIRGTVNFDNLDNHNLYIGVLSTARWSSTTFNFNGVADNINIYRLGLYNEATVNGLEAKKNIKISRLEVARYGNTITIKAPNITIDYLLQSDIGNGLSKVVLYGDNINIGQVALGQEAILEIHPYTPGKKVKFYSNAIISSSSSSIILDSGDYYTNFFSIPGTSDNVSSIRAGDANQVINFYINGDFKPGNNAGINSAGNRGNFGNLPANNFRLFINGDLDTGGGGTTFNALIYVEGKAALGSPTYIKGALSTGKDVIIYEGTEFYRTSLNSNPLIGVCSNRYTNNKIGTFNVIEGDTVITKDPVDPNASENALKTKVVNSAFNVKIVHLGDDNETLTPYTGAVEVDLIKTPSNSQECATNPTRWSRIVYFDNSSEVNLSNIVIPFAIKDASFRVKYLKMNIPQSCISFMVKGGTSVKPEIELSLNLLQCINDLINMRFPVDIKNCIASCDVTTSENQYGNTHRHRHGPHHLTGMNCVFGCLSNNTSTASGNSVCSRDNFAIRPYAFKVFGNNEYKRAGEDFDLVIKAVDENNDNIILGDYTVVRGVNDYNEALSDLNITSVFYTPTSAELAKMQSDTGETQVAYCPDEGNFVIKNSSDKVKDGEANVTLNYDETGILSVRVGEKKGNEFAKVDADDTPDEERFIKPATVILDKSDINKTDLLVFIPYKFKTVADYKTTTDDSWVYMSNKVPQMAAYIDYHILALNKNGDIVQNFTKTCFPDTSSEAPKRNGLKLNTTFDLLLDVTLFSDTDTNISLYTADEDGNAIWTKQPVADLKAGTNKVQEWVGPTAFENGESKVKVYFNVNKNYSKPADKVVIKLVDANTSTLWMNNKGATNIFEGSSVNKDVDFLYGRIALNGNIATYSSNEINTTVKYMYWDKNRGWIVNNKHTDALKHGDLNLANTYVAANGVKPLSSSSIQITPSSINNGEEKVSIVTTHALPYSAKIHFAIPSWLWYHPLAKEYKDPSLTNLDCLTHPCTKVTYIKTARGWAGVGKKDTKYNESNTTTKVNVDNKASASKNEVKKLNW